MDRSFDGCFKRMVLIYGDSILQKGFGELLKLLKESEERKESLRTADHSCVRHSDKLEREESMTFKLCCCNHQEGPQKDTSHLR